MEEANHVEETRAIVGIPDHPGGADAFDRGAEIVRSCTGEFDAVEVALDGHIVDWRCERLAALSIEDCGLRF
jgi:hypothetical protein